MTTDIAGRDPAAAQHCPVCRPQPGVYGLIQWGGAHTPTLIVGDTVSAVQRAAVRLVVSRSTDGRTPDDQAVNVVAPGPDAADSAISAWLAGLHAATTVVSFTLYDAAGSNLVGVPSTQQDGDALTGGPAGQLVVDGELIEVWAEPLDTGFVRIDLCTTGGVGCGEAELGNGLLRIELPDAWSSADRAAAACVVARIAFAAGAA
ncbi:hypothetical protein ABZS66_22720 [Dactylosporangium sp. NPDC005572]|uniref:hypothetical protein n=1 Tax=Dactylosporangium sp. NPDC005572 TaxID=3156889 RepID=UPI0033A5A504